MKKKILAAIGIVIILIVAAGFFYVYNFKSDNAKYGPRLYVGGTGPQNFTSIQAAIDAASEKTTILVFGGTYYENVIVDKPIMLIGNERSNTIIDGGATGTVVTIKADDVTLKHFTIQNSGIDCSGIKLDGTASDKITGCTISNNNYIDNDYGIYFEYSDNNNLIDNTANSNGYDGIHLEASSNNILRNNTANSNYWHDGIYLHNSPSNTLTNNIANDNSYNGIYLMFSPNNALTSNTANSNYYGIYLRGASGNTLTNNIANTNKKAGITLDYSSNNILTNNAAGSNRGAGIALGFSSSNTIEDNVVNLNDWGIYSVYSLDSTIKNNAVNSNNYDGISIRESTGITLMSNTANYNNIGIHQRQSPDNTFTGNTADSNGLFNTHSSYSSEKDPSYDVGAGDPSGSGNTYYVSTTGNDINNGLTEGTAWRTITYAATQAQAGDTVYVKSGDYGVEYVIITNSGTEDNPIVFQGYKNMPGDIPEPDEMPLLDGSDPETGWGILVEEKEYIKIKYFKIEEYQRLIWLNDAKHVTLDNLVGTNGGAECIKLLNSHYNSISDCVMTDGAMTGIGLQNSNYNALTDCDVYGVSIDAVQVQDYYIDIQNGHDNILRNCSSQNKHPTASVHRGHGIGIKDDFDYKRCEYVETNSYNNKFINCVAEDNDEPFYISHEAHHNEFRNCTIISNYIYGDNFVIRDGAYSNTIIGLEGGNTVEFTDSKEGPELDMPPPFVSTQINKDNSFINCVFDGLGTGIFAQSAEKNTFKNCVFTNLYRLFQFRGENSGNRIINCIITGITSHNYTEDGAIGSPTITYSAFYNNVFPMPAGTGNIEADPLFADVENEDYHLKSEYGRWDGVKWTYDTVLSPCIDAGDPNDDYTQEPQPNGGRVNMGAYGDTANASKSHNSGE